MFIQTNDVQAQTDGPVTLSLTPVTLDLKPMPVTLDLEPAIKESVTADQIMALPAFDEEVLVTALPVFDGEAVVTALPVIDEEALVTILPAIDEEALVTTLPAIDEEALVTTLPAIDEEVFVTTLPVFDSESEELQAVQITGESQIVTYAQDLGVIATLYSHILGREADTEGFQWWAEKEATGDISLGGVAVSMIESEEFLASNSLDFGAQSKDDQIESLYQTILQRDSDQSGKDYWIEQSEQNGMTIQEIAQSFVESEEFAEQSLAPEAWDFLLA